jgi:chromosome segregation ATPase
VDGNATYTRPKQLDRAYALTWTLRDADAVGYDAKGWRLSVSPDKDGIAVMLEERELMIAEKEESLQSLQEHIAAREATQAKQAKDLAATGEMQQKQSESLEAREATLAKQAVDLEAREAALGRQDADLEGREVALAKQVLSLEIKEAALARQAANLEARESELERPCGHITEISLLKAENDNLHLQLRTSSLEREVEKVRQRSNSLSHTEQLNMLETEKARLRVLLHAEQQKVRASPSPRRSNDFPSVFNSPSSLANRPTKDPRNSIFGQTSRPGSSSGLAVQPPSAVPPLTVTPKSS